LNTEDEKAQAQHYLKRQNYYYDLLSPIQAKLSGAVQHAISRLGGTTPITREPIPPNSAFRAYYGYNELHGRNLTNNDYQPPSFIDDIHLDEDELLPFATTSDSATQKISHRQVPREEEHFFVVEKFQRPKDWGAVADLDCFFSSVYNYYYHRGLYHIIGKGVLELLSLVFTLALSIVLFAFLDWRALFQCRDETTCHESFSDYLVSKPFAKFSIGNAILFVYCLIVTVYGILATFRFYATVKDAFHARIFYENKLGISTRKLEGGAVEWHHIVDKIIQLQESGEYRVAIQAQLDELGVAQRILRKENFLVALFNLNILDLRLPSIGSFFSGTRHSSSGESNYYLCTSMEWSLYACMLNHMFNRQHKIRPAFYMDPTSLQRRFIIAGVAHAVFMPFLLFFMTLHFLLLNLYVWRSSKQYLGPREWSTAARWKFREFNELPHIFERRLGPSYKAAEDYLNLFTQSALISYIGRALVFLSGSIIAVLLSFAAINDAILLHVKISQWNLLWFVGMLSVAFSVGKGMLPNEEIHPPYSFNLHAEMEDALAKVAVYTHYFPETWRKRSWKKETQTDFSALFQHKSRLFASEILSTLFAPYVLCVALPRCATNICAFVHKTKVELPGLGETCGYSCFDFDAFQDENWEGRQLGAAVEEDDAHSFIFSNDKPKTRQGKMEKSFFSFKASNPDWNCKNTSGKKLVELVERFRQQEALAMEKERQVHIEAAVKQLEALRCYEKSGGEEQPYSSDVAARISTSEIDENYVTLPNKDQEELVSSAERAAGHGIQQETHKRSVQKSVPNFAFVDSTSEDIANSRNTPSNLLKSSPFPIAPRITSSNVPSNFGSFLGNYDQSLSTELRAVLDQSIFDPSVSMADLSLGKTALMSHTMYFSRGGCDKRLLLEGTLEDQYKCLERYHSHLAECTEVDKLGVSDSLT